ncbi:phosphopantetheine--transferase domain protein [Lyngbya aestuarii BL J]|uniref:Phosphopantetheine--transferase domain protein n=1 Tax=Lyngbya aestuarii BL J TaxID=1348334 RepID=U7QLP9_9CYAN|nr:4'-phosphopantetheinyl transferase superfamily protein [Lyngbya aestuarii]ERT08020.1 phosphopantetheine--transferase domain protein [Lyngbya aestuarii BL J]
MNLIWNFPLTEYHLSSDEVQVWLAEFGELNEQLHEFEQLLSPDERERANRYRQQRDRVRFIVARGVLRIVLAGYLGLSPSELEFNYSERGKPQLKTNSTGIEFNVSHSEDKALFAIALNRRVGIDIELIRPMEVLQLAKRFFRESEYLFLRALEDREQIRGFFQLWTAKEAYVKATGEGLAGLETVEISLPKLESAENLAVQGQGCRWMLHSLDLGNNYCAAIAVEGKEYKIKCWQFRLGS